MSDIYSKAKRSQIMSLIQTKATKLEVIVRAFLQSKRIAFRSNAEYLPGKPDIILPRRKIAIFIHGCFWHGHTCASGRLPKTNVEFWKLKIAANKARDRKSVRLLKKDGWLVLTIWQCEIKSSSKREISLSKLLKKILGSNA